MTANLTVLYVEDEEDIREMTEFALEDEGFELVMCSSGQEALVLAPDVSPDLLLLDMMMPGMDGLTTAARLKEFPHLANVPLIFMTAKVQPNEVEHYREMGASGVIPKPFDAMELPEKIRQILAEAACA